jgi:hypothetical protein
MGEVISKSVDTQVAHHCALLQLRCQDRIVQSDNFAAAWNLANEKQQKECLRLLRRMKTDKLKRWISEILFEDLSAQRVVVLRRLASNYHVKGYCNMDKEALLKAIQQRGIPYGKSESDSK